MSITPSKSLPTGKPGNPPGGIKTPIPARADPETERSLKRENEAASILAAAGYKLEQNPAPTPDGKKPDYKLEDEYADCLAPKVDQADRIYYKIQGKLGQAATIVLNLDDSEVPIDDMRKVLSDYPIPGLKEVIVVKGGTIISIYP
jgi:hypothetical protein